MAEDFSSCSKPKEVFDELLCKLASGYVITEDKGNTFGRLKGKVDLDPVEKTEAKNPEQFFEILQRKGILKSPDVGKLEEYFTDVDYRAIPLIKQAESRIQQLQGNKESSTNNWPKYDNVRNNEEDIGKILDETIDGMEEDDHADDTSKELKSILGRLRSKFYIKENEILPIPSMRILLEYNQETRDTYRTCRDEVERRIQKADQQPRATVFLRQILHEDSNLGFGNENSTDVSEMLDDLEREGKIGPQKYSYFSKIMNKLDPRLMEIVARPQKKLREHQEVLLRRLKKMIKEIEGNKELEQGSHCGKRRREDEEEERSHKRQEVNGWR